MNEQQSLEFAKEYLEDLLTFFGVNIMVDGSVNDGIIQLDVPAIEESSILIGRSAETLQSIQSTVSAALRNKNAEIIRVNVDIAGYKKQRAEKIAEQARGWIDEVRRTGDSHIANLNAADRRIVHQVATEYADIRTFSEGEGRDRRIVIAQASS